MNYKDKYIKYKSKYLQLQNIKKSNNILKAGATIASASTIIPFQKPKSVPIQNQGIYSTCWAHAYARSFVRTFQVLDIITDDKIEQWYELFYAILLQKKNCQEGGNFSEMIYLFNYLKDNINTIFTITKENIKCVKNVCSVEEKKIPILQFDSREQEDEIKKNLQFLFDNKLIFLYLYFLKNIHKKHI